MEDLLTEAGEEQIGSHRGEAALLLAETTTTKLGMCQVRSNTDNPCLRPAAIEIWGIPFCEGCAREQEAYFAIGKLTQE